MNNDNEALPAAPESGKPPFYIQPQDEIEDELLNQMKEIACASAHCIEQGMRDGMGFGGKIGYIGLAAKLSRTYAALVQALDYHRGKGVTKQEIIVQYVNVAQGGQAIVGNVSPRQGGGRQKSAKQPSAKQINHAPQFTMPSPNAHRQPVPVSGNGEW